MIPGVDEMNTNSLDRIYNNLNLLLEDCSDFPETTKSEDDFWKLVDQNFPGKNNMEMLEFENALYQVAHCHQRQGFMYGVKFVMEILQNLP